MLEWSGIFLLFCAIEISGKRKVIENCFRHKSAAARCCQVVREVAVSCGPPHSVWIPVFSLWNQVLLFNQKITFICTKARCFFVLFDSVFGCKWCSYLNDCEASFWSSLASLVMVPSTCHRQKKSTSKSGTRAFTSVEAALPSVLQNICKKVAHRSLLIFCGWGWWLARNNDTDDNGNNDGRVTHRGLSAFNCAA